MSKYFLTSLVLMAIINNTLSAYSAEYINEYRAKNFSKENSQELNKKKKNISSKIQKEVNNGEQACKKAKKTISDSDSDKEMDLYFTCESYRVGEHNKMLRYYRFQIKAINLELKSRNKK